MPILRVKHKNIYFAHVPKCGGSTVEHNLIRLGYSVSFLNVDYYNPGEANWSVTSPQHISLQNLEKYFKKNFFDYSFAVVRDPVDRFISAYNFKRGTIGWFVSFERFLTMLESHVERTGSFSINKYDNHFTPASQLVPEASEIFYLENGLLNVFRELENRIGLVEINEIVSQNTGQYSDFLAKTPAHKFVKDNFVRVSPKRKNLSTSQVERIKALYVEDYDRFY